MEHDQTFRIVLLVGFALLLPVGGYYRLRTATREKLDRRQEGWFILLTLRPLGVIGMAGLIAFLIDPAWMAWSAVPLPLWWRWMGVGVGVLAGLLLIWTFHTLGPNLTDTVVTRKQATLVTTGPYRWVRHPFYLAFALTMVANSLATANVFVAVAGGLAFLLLVIRTRKEEDKLLEHFGEEYRRYMAKTGRFVPCWNRP
jgi:protein-S-isoprenylcysteine O-methyltransferase Ste14